MFIWEVEYTQKTLSDKILLVLLLNFIIAL